MSKKWKIAGINFDHMHMGDLLRQASEHPKVEIVGISDEQPERMEMSIRTSTSRATAYSTITARASRRRSRISSSCVRPRRSTDCGQNVWRNSACTSWSRNRSPRRSPKPTK
jgi:hypothetical protein